MGTSRPCPISSSITRAGMMLTPGAVRHRFLDHLNIVEMQRDVHMHVMLAQKPIDVFANRKVFIEADEIQAVQILRFDFGILR